MNEGRGTLHYTRVIRSDRPIFTLLHLSDGFFHNYSQLLNTTIVYSLRVYDHLLYLKGGHNKNVCTVLKGGVSSFLTVKLLKLMCLTVPLSQCRTKTRYTHHHYTHYKQHTQLHGSTITAYSPIRFMEMPRAAASGNDYTPASTHTNTVLLS